MTKRFFLQVLCIAFSLVSVNADPLIKMLPKGLTPQKTAEILIQDDKFGFRAIDRAVAIGDRIIPHLRTETEDFENINYFTIGKLASVLGSIKTEDSLNILRELSASEKTEQKLVGLLGLQRQGVEFGEIMEMAWLLDLLVVKKHESPNGKRISYRPSRYESYAFEALGRSQSPTTLDFLHTILLKPVANQEDFQMYSNWQTKRDACAALARIGHTKSIPTIRKCLKDPDFGPDYEAFRAGINCGDKEVVPLAIARIEPDKVALIKGLKAVTWKHFGDDKAKWQDWWDRKGESWSLPDRIKNTSNWRW